jgi:hypothetical protein
MMPKRPEYTPEERTRIASHVLEQLALGRSTKKIFDEDGAKEALCARSCWNSWLLNDQSLEDSVARARRIGLSAIVEEMVEIADDKTGDTDAQSRRVRIYARERMAAMLAPAVFGQKLDVTSGGKPLEAPKNVTHIDNRIQSVLMLVQQRKDDAAALAGLLE